MSAGGGKRVTLTLTLTGVLVRAGWCDCGVIILCECLCSPCGVRVFVLCLWCARACGVIVLCLWCACVCGMRVVQYVSARGVFVLC